MLEKIVFYCFAALLVFSAGMVVTRRNPVHAALFLVLSFFASAAIWLLLQAEFLAIVLILVYVGAVMVLFLFVVMMLDINVTVIKEGFASNLPIGIAVALMMLVSIGLMVTSTHFDIGLGTESITRGADYSNTRELGLALYTDYLYPFEIAGAILLVAIVAAITLAMRKPRTHKTPKPEQQVAVDKDARIRIVKMEAEK